MLRPVIYQFFCLFLFSLLLYAAASKLFDYTLFRQQLNHSPLIRPLGLAPILVIAVPVAEITIASLITIPATRLKGLYASLVLMSVFTTYLGVAMVSGLKLPCACGGILNGLSWEAHLVFNIAVIAMNLLAIRYHSMKDLTMRAAMP